MSRKGVVGRGYPWKPQWSARKQSTVMRTSDFCFGLTLVFHSQQSCPGSYAYIHSCASCEIKSFRCDLKKIGIVDIEQRRPFLLECGQELAQQHQRRSAKVSNRGM